MAKTPNKRASRRKLVIPPPSGDKEPLKTNVYRFTQTSNAALAPLFPYFDEGSIVPCSASFRGGKGVNYGRFQHFNTVDEVVLTFGAAGTRARAGVVRVGAKLHMVSDPFMTQEDREDPNAIRLSVITQRQTIGKTQREEYRFVCEKCDRRLYVERVDATPPKRGKQAKTLGPNAAFLTILETYTAAKHFNDDPKNRKCKNCGHQNAPFPISGWGWDAYTDKSAVARITEESLRAAAR